MEFEWCPVLLLEIPESCYSISILNEGRKRDREKDD